VLLEFLTLFLQFFCKDECNNPHENVSGVIHYPLATTTDCSQYFLARLLTYLWQISQKSILRPCKWQIDEQFIPIFFGNTSEELFKKF
jgi:hypothetical protein